MKPGVEINNTLCTLVPLHCHLQSGISVKFIVLDRVFIYLYILKNVLEYYLQITLNEVVDVEVLIVICNVNVLFGDHII